MKGVYDTTLAPVVDAAAHPVQTVENAASNLVEGVKDVVKDPKGTLTGDGWLTLLCFVCVVSAIDGASLRMLPLG